MGSEQSGRQGHAFEQLCAIIANIIGADAVEILGIQPSSKFVADLGMDSIQIVALIEQSNTAYEGTVDFLTWLTAKSYLDLIGLTVGDVAEFVEESLRPKAEVEL